MKGVFGSGYLFTLFFLLFTQLVSGQNKKIDSLLIELNDSPDATERIDLLNDLSFALFHTNPASASDDVAIALKESSEINYIHGLAESYKNYGNINTSVGKYPEALKNFMQAEEFYSALSDDLGVAFCYNNIGQLYMMLKDFDKSREYLLKAVAIKERFGISVSLLKSYNNIGDVYLLQNNLQKAEESYQRVLNLDSASPSVLIYTYKGLGDIAARKGFLTRANHYYQLSLDHIEYDDNYRDLAELNNRRGLLYEQLDKPDSAFIFYQNALQQGEKISAPDILANSHLGLMRVNSLAEDYKTALYHYQQYYTLKDSIINQEKLNQIARLNVEYGTELLKKENETTQATIKQQKTLIIGIVMIMFLFIALAGTFYKQQKNHQRVNYLLASKNKEINLQKEEIQCQAQKLSALNRQLEQVNENLEKEVRERTQILLDQNKKLAEYAYTNAHELRAPVANILGLVNILKYSSLAEKEKEIIQHLSKATADLDKVIITIRKKLEEETY